MISRLFKRLFAGDGQADRDASTICHRLPSNPIVTPQMLPGRDGGNINGPSLIRTPDWLPGRLGRYYLYFAHHHGETIRLAYADELDGPWTVHDGGTLGLGQVPACRDHIASPDVHIEPEHRRIRMYFHGVPASGRGQKSYVALSDDGLHFSAHDEALGPYYFRVAPWRGEWIAMSKGGLMHRSRDGLTGFAQETQPAFRMRDPEANAPGDVRHVALQCSGDTLLVYFSRIGDAPERILRAAIDLTREPWVAGKAEEVLRPETDWEGAKLAVRGSRAGAALRPENALRDPAVFEDDGRLYLLYSTAGESGIGIAELLERQ